MARSLDLTDVKRGDLLRVFPEDLIVNQEKRGRYFKPTAEAVEELAADIAARGQEQPVAVSITHDRKLELYAGFTRWEAIMLLNSRAADPEGKRRIECVVKDRNAEEAFIGNIKENRIRNHTTVIDDAHNIRRLSEQFHKTDEEIMALYGKPGDPMSPGWLEGMRALVRLPEDDQAKIHAGELSKSVGIQLANMPPEMRDAVLATAKVEGNGKVTTTSVVAAARKHGALRSSTALRMPEVKTSWTYLATEHKNPNVQKLAKGFLEYQAGKLAEPDWYRLVAKLLS